MVIITYDKASFHKKVMTKLDKTAVSRHFKIFQIVNNLASIPARLFFRGIEASTYKFLAMTLERGKLIRYQDKVYTICTNNLLFQFL